MAPTKPAKKTSQKGDAKRRKVAFLAANDQSPQQIAPQVQLKERRVQQLLKEIPTQEMIEHFRRGIEARRIDAETAALATAVEHLSGPKWEVAFDRIMGRMQAREQVEIAALTAMAPAASAGNAVQVNVQGGPVSLEELLAPHRPVVGVE